MKHLDSCDPSWKSDSPALLFVCLQVHLVPQGLGEGGIIFTLQVRGTRFTDADQLLSPPSSYVMKPRLNAGILTPNSFNKNNSNNCLPPKYLEKYRDGEGKGFKENP